MTSHSDHATTDASGSLNHPLDPLSAEEIVHTTSLVAASGRINPRVRIMAYTLLEPAKDVVLTFQQASAQSSW